MLKRGFTLLLRIPMSIYVVGVLFYSTAEHCTYLQTHIHKPQTRSAGVCETHKAFEAYCKQTSSHRPDSTPQKSTRDLKMSPRPRQGGCVFAISLSPQRLLLTLPQTTQQQKSCFPYKVVLG